MVATLPIGPPAPSHFYQLAWKDGRELSSQSTPPVPDGTRQANFFTHTDDCSGLFLECYREQVNPKNGHTDSVPIYSQLFAPATGQQLRLPSKVRVLACLGSTLIVHDGTAFRGYSTPAMKPLWRFASSALFQCGDEDSFLIGGVDGPLRALDTRSGRLLWKVSLECEQIGLGSKSILASRRSRKREVVLLDRTSGKMREFRLESPTQQFFSLGNYHLAQTDQDIQCLDSSSSKPLWKIPADQFFSFCCADSQRCYLRFLDSSLRAVDWKSGRTLWTLPKRNAEPTLASGPYLVVANRIPRVVTNEDKSTTELPDRYLLECFDSASGQPLWHSFLESRYALLTVSSKGLCLWTSGTAGPALPGAGP